MKYNPFKGIAAYNSSDSDIRHFKGREESISKFLRIMSEGTMSVLYANSGIGKTSFLNAGIAPLMQRNGYYPVHILFPDNFFSKSESVIKKDFLNLVVEEVEKIPEGLKEKTYEWRFRYDTLLQGLENDIVTDVELCEDSIWWRLHAYDLIDLRTGNPVKPFIIFDQFEEVFQKTKGNKVMLNYLFSCIEEMASNSLPKDVETTIEELSEKDVYLDLDTKNDYKVVFSLRQEYLSEFDYWTNDRHSIAGLLQNRMLLLPLTRKQAFAVITEQPADDGGQTFITTLNPVKERIVQMVDSKNKDEVEPFILSVLCSILFDKAIAEGKEQMMPDDITHIDPSRIMKPFYEGILDNAIKEGWLDAITIEQIENILVSEDDGHRMRKTESDDNSLKDLLKKNAKLIERLEKNHLIRTNTIGDYTYIEIIHDRIADIIHFRQKERIEAKKKIKENKLLWFFRVSWIAILCVLSWFCINYGLHHYEYSQYSELYIGTQYSKPGNRSLYEEDNLLERLIVRGQDSITLTTCYMLRSVEFEEFDKDTLYITIKDCPALENVHIPSRVSFLDIGNIHNCPKLKLEIGKNIKGIRINACDNSFEFNTQKNKHFIWIEKTLWDMNINKPLYSQLQEGTYEVSIPYETKGNKDSLVSFNGSNKLVKRIFVQKGMIFPQTFTYRDTFYVTPSTPYDSIPQNIINVKFHDSINEICHNFNGCKDIYELEIPKTVKNIGDRCFSNCTGLQSLTIKGNTTIGEEAFANCRSLQYVYFDCDSIVLKDNVFANCINLSNISFPSHIEFGTYSVRLDEDALEMLPYSCNPFFGCFRLANINLQKNNNLKLKNGLIIYEDSIPILSVRDDFSFKKKGYSANNNGIFLSSGKIKDISPIIIRKPQKGTSFSSHFSYITDSVFFDKYMGVISLFKPKRILTIPKAWEKVHFLPGNLDNLEVIIMPFPQPKKVTLDLPDSIKERITLVIPDGCTRYYECIPEFSAFKAIKESGKDVDIYRNFVSDTFLSNYAVSTFLGYYYLWIPLIFIIIITIYFYLRHSNRTRLSALASGSGYVFLMLVTYFPIYWLIFFTTRTSMWSNVIAIIISVVLCCFLIFGKNIAGFILTIIDWLKEFIHITLPVIVKKIITYRLILLFILFAILSVSVGVVVYNNSQDIDRAVANKNWKRAVNLLYKKIQLQDSLSIQDSDKLRNLLISSIEIQNMTDNERIFKRNNYQYNDNGSVVIFSDQKYGKTIYDLVHMKIKSVEPESESDSPFARVSYFYMKDKYYYFTFNDTTFVYSTEGICKDPQIILGNIYDDNDSSVCIRRDSTYLIYSIEDWTPVDSVKARCYRERVIYDKHTKMYVIQSKRNWNDSIFSVHVVNEAKRASHNFELSERVVRILKNEYLVTCKDSIIRFYDMENRKYLSDSIHGELLSHKNSDVVVVRDNKSKITLYGIDAKTSELISYNYNINWDNSRVWNNYIKWEDKDSLYMLRTKDMKLYNLGINNKYTRSLNDTLLIRYVDSIETHYFYSFVDSIKLLNTLKAQYYDLSFYPPYMTLKNDSALAVYDMTDSLKKSKEFRASRYWNWNIKDGYFYQYHSDLASLYFPVDGEPDETVKIEGQIKTPIYNGWCFTQVGSYYSLVNIDPLRSLIRKSELLSEDKKQNLYRLIDKLKSK